MDTGWYVNSDSGVKGPFAAAALKGMAQQGEVVPSTMVRHGTDGNWVAASHVKGLFGPQAEPPIAALPVENVSGSNMAELLGEAAEEEAVSRQQQDRMAELLEEASAEEAIRRQQRQVESESRKASRLVPCVDCDKAISRLASACPNCGCPVITPSPPDKYPALKFIAGVNKFFAFAIPILCLFGLVSIINVGAANAMTILPLVVYMILAPLILWGSAELILLLIGIESNTSTLRGMNRQQQK